MGSIISNNNTMKEYTSVDDFEFHGQLEEQDTNNGLFFNGTFIPEEILLQILSFIPPHKLLPLTLVCKKWCNLIKSESLWIEIYNKEHPHKAKLLPWYVYYLYYTTDSFNNLLKNGNGEDEFKNWMIIKNLGDAFKIEKTPIGADLLPEGVPDFNGHTSCFATSYYECNKLQIINLKEKRLLRYVLKKFKPKIMVSEWVAGRFDCGCQYNLSFRGVKRIKIDDDEVDEQPLFEQHKEIIIPQWSGGTWQKVEILIEDYPSDVQAFVFEHEGRDTQFWKGHYGSKMAGGVVKILFDTLITDQETN